MAINVLPVNNQSYICNCKMPNLFSAVKPLCSACAISCKGECAGRLMFWNALSSLIKKNQHLDYITIHCALSRENRGKLQLLRVKLSFYCDCCRKYATLIGVSAWFCRKFNKTCNFKTFFKKCIDKFAKVEYTNNIKDSKGAVSWGLQCPFLFL